MSSRVVLIPLNNIIKPFLVLLINRNTLQIVQRISSLQLNMLFLTLYSLLSKASASTKEQERDDKSHVRVRMPLHPFTCKSTKIRRAGTSKFTGG
jgi:hypothetical protein